MIENSFLSLP
jgi:L-iduronidase